MQIQISWLLQKPTDLDLHCLQMQGISGFSRTRVKVNGYKFKGDNSVTIVYPPFSMHHVLINSHFTPVWFYVWLKTFMQIYFKISMMFLFIDNPLTIEKEGRNNSVLQRNENILANKCLPNWALHYPANTLQRIATTFRRRLEVMMWPRLKVHMRKSK